MSDPVLAVVSADWTAVAVAEATIALAVLTGLLVVATFAAVIVGGRAALSASNTFALESEPVITIRLIETADEERVLGNKIAADYLIVGKPALGDGIEIRPLAPGEPRTGRAGMIRPSILLEVQNVGRSPALELAIPFRASAADMSKERMVRAMAGARDTKAEFVAEGEIKLLGIAAQSVAYVRFFHDFGIIVTLSAVGTATIRPIRGSGAERVNVTLVSEGPFVIKDPTWYEHAKKQAPQPDGPS
ncbi:MAG TPA: hypothetical protein VGG89_16790 [Candidatus Baltobacteraceae bacterium]|jgi:hypothetical protein